MECPPAPMADGAATASAFSSAVDNVEGQNETAAGDERLNALWREHAERARRHRALVSIIHLDICTLLSVPCSSILCESSACAMEWHQWWHT